MITGQGYRIEKDKVSIDILNKLQVKKAVNETFADNTQELTILRESEKYYYLPRFYGIKNIGDVPINLPYKNIDVTFTGQLTITKINQPEVMNIILPKLLKNYGGIISLPCGSGKTVMSLYILCQLKVKTLIIVHKDFLKNQWINSIKQFIKEFSGDNSKTIGVIKQNIFEPDNDIVVASLQTLCKRNYSNKQLKDFGLIIVDECHHIAADMFHNALDKINSKYIIGLSATPTRKDGLTKILKWYLGDFLYKVNCNQNTKVEIFMLNYKSDDKEHFKEIFFNKGYKQVISITQMVTNLTKIKERNNIIINILLYYSKTERNIIILSERVEHLKNLKKEFDKLTNNTIKTGLYIGKTTNKDREYIEQNCKFIFGTYSLAQEGLDIKRLDTLIMASPQKDITQSIGRVMRQNNINSHIIDIADDLSIFKSYCRYRYKIYDNGKYTVKSKDYNIDDLELYKDNFNELFE